jgi:uroporphyrinogen-III synthase
MPLILSTKVLPANLKKHLFLSDIGLVEYDAVKIKPAETAFSKSHFENAIFTSQNALKLAFEKHELKFENVFCVGEKTASLIQSYGLQPKLIAQNAGQLAEELSQHFPEMRFDFFCSSQRRDELPDLLKQNNINLKEHHLYQSVSDGKIFSNDFDAVLCFSPLGVKAYYENHNKQPMAICIGETTAAAARTFTDMVLVANKTSLESVIVKTIKRFYLM